MAKEYIEKWSVVSKLTDIENKCQKFKPFNEAEHEMYRMICEAEISIGKTAAADVVELPCKVGDIVWTLKRAWRKEDGVAPFQITNLTITQNKKGVWTKKYRAMILVDGKTRDWSHDFAFDEIGKDTFFTKEDAEKALLCGAGMGERRDNNAQTD